MYQFAAAQQTSTVKLPAFFLRFQTKERILRVNESEITGENAFNRDLFETEDNHESIKDEKTWLQVFLQISYPYFNPQTAKTYIYIFGALLGFCNF